MNLRCFILLSLCLTAFPGSLFAEGAEERTGELNAYWAEVSRSVREGDFKGYQATCHPDGTLVNGIGAKTYPLAKALAGWEKDFIATRSGEKKGRVEFRFSQRLNDESTAHETGIFRYSTTTPDGVETVEFIHFQGLLVKRNGNWLIMMEYQKSRATEKEWGALKPKA